MTEPRRPADDWARTQRRRWSSARIAAAVALHAVVLVSLRLAFDRVDLPRHGAERATTLVSVTLHAAPPPPAHTRPALPPVRSPLRSPARVTPARAPAPATARAPAPPPAPDDAAHAITLPTPPVVAAAAPPAPASQPDLAFLDNAATRQAIRAVARGDTLSSHANALTHEEPGTELVAADGSHAGTTRNLPPPPPAQLLAQNIAAAHKGDCGKGEYLGGGMGLLSTPFLLAAEAMGKCAHKS